MGFLKRPRRVILRTDIVGSTEKAVELGDLEWRELLETHHAILRKHLQDLKGREIRPTGDGFVFEFGTLEDAQRCAQLMEEDVVRLGIKIRTSIERPAP
jgi:class 3 adenylate cyclase